MLCVRAIVVVLASLMLAAGASASTDAAGRKGATTRTTLTRATALEDLVLHRINAVRAARGLAPLSRSSGLSRSAVVHSRAMATLGFFSHESRDGTPFSARIERFYAPGSKPWSVGENLAMFGGTAPTAEGIVTAWMGSPDHRANLLRGLFREAGVGVIFNAAAGGVFGGEATWVVTLDLGRR